MLSGLHATRRPLLAASYIASTLSTITIARDHIAVLAKLLVLVLVAVRATRPVRGAQARGGGLGLGRDSGALTLALADGCLVVRTGLIRTCTRRAREGTVYTAIYCVVY